MTKTFRASALVVAVLAVALGGHLTHDLGVAAAQGAAQSVDDGRQIQPLLATA